MAAGVIWYLKQLLPLQYVSEYVGDGNRRELAIWRMWMGRCFGIRTYEVYKENRSEVSCIYMVNGYCRLLRRRVDKNFCPCRWSVEH